MTKPAAAILRWFSSGLKVIPSLVQLAVVEIMATACLGAGVVARVLDQFGIFGHPPVAPLSWGILGWLLVGSWFLWLALRHIWRPGVQNVEWSPVRRLGPVDIVVPNDPWATQYQFLGSHPAYVLMDLLAGVIPAFMTYVSWGDDPKLNPTRHVYHCWLVVWAMVPLARVLCWYGLRRGPEVIRAMTPGMSDAARRHFEWTKFWKGPLVFWAIVLMVTGPPWIMATREQQRFDASIPVLNAAIIKVIHSTAAQHDDERYRVRGTLRGPLKQWPGGDGKYESAGFVLALEDGPEIAVFVDVHQLKAAKKLTAAGDGALVTCLVRTLGAGGKVIPEHYYKLYNWNENDMGPVPDKVKKFTSDGRRMLTRYVDP